MELITIYFIALTWCGLGMVGAQISYSLCYPDMTDHRDDARARKGFLKGAIAGPVYFLYMGVIFFWVWLLFDRDHD